MYKTIPVCCILYQLMILTTCDNSETAVELNGEDSNHPIYHVLQDGTTLRFLAKPPIYDIKRAGTTTWYPCEAEVVQSNQTSTTTPPPTHEVVMRWLVPDGIPKLNYSSGNWSTLEGHGYFVDKRANNTLVLVHPEESYEGRYTCQAILGATSLTVNMQLHLLFYDRWSFLLRTGFGFLGAAVVGAAIGLFWLVHHFLIRPYVKKMRAKERLRVPVNIEGQDLEEAQPSLKDT